MSKRTARLNKPTFKSADSIYDMDVLRAFSKASSMKSMFDKRKTKRRMRKFMSAKSSGFRFQLP